MGRFAVTFEEFDHYCILTGRALKPDEGWGRGTLPVLNVSFDEAIEYAGWHTIMFGQVARLPTGDEWEYAARAGSLTRFCWGDWIEPGDANFDETPGFGPFPVASLRPNPWGLYNVMGNVAEWVQESESGACEAHRRLASRHATRGGHWASPIHELSLSEVRLTPEAKGSDRVGFRLAFDP